MEAAFWIYLYLTIGNLAWVVELATFVAIGASIFWVVAWLHEADPDEDPEFATFSKWTKRAIITALSLLVVSTFYPSREDLAWMFGGATVYSLTQNEEAQKLPDNVLKAANTFLEGISEPEKAK